MSTPRLNLFLIIIFGVTLPLSVVLSTHLARKSFERVKLRDQTISVKGYAERRITSDRATWYACIDSESPDLRTAYAGVERGRDRLVQVLATLGVKSNEHDLTAPTYATLYKRDEKGNPTNQVEFYRVSQPVHLETTDVQLVRRVSQAAGELIRDGIQITSSAPQYHYTGMNEMKLQMLSEASTNARSRAEMLIGTNGRLGGLRNASQGVFQITSPLSTEVSDLGISDTESIDKVIKAVVTLEFAIE